MGGYKTYWYKIKLQNYVKNNPFLLSSYPIHWNSSTFDYYNYLTVELERRCPKCLEDCRFSFK